MAQFFERHQGGDRALLVHLDLQESQLAEVVEELELLVDSAGAVIVDTIIVRRRSIESKTFIGSGKAEEIQRIVEHEEVDVVIFNHALTPAQERNLEELFQCRVLDRTTLILDIFAQRARSHEGKLQVELAQLRHLSTRLIRGWTHLERQKGGIGLRGPGETQLESDRRMIGQRIKQIIKRLEKVEATRNLGRRSRKRNTTPTISLVGYTNAGKSSLFNRLTDAGLYTANQLFATLDPTLRSLKLPGGRSVVLADTVGFIRDLPHDLVQAFRSTLIETTEADLLIHVIDAVHEDRRDHIDQVNAVLTEIGADQVPQLEIYNKIDLAEGIEPRVDRNGEGEVERIWLSAKSGTGVEALLHVLTERYSGELQQGILYLHPHEGKLHAELHQEGGVTSEQFTEEGGWKMEVELPRKTLDHLHLLERVEPLIASSPDDSEHYQQENAIHEGTRDAD
ncbi:MAG: GTPase HflX [Gammaproteobacteria bacterium]|nr:GTPase HflX [Gammaproteobacteria bacterium]MBT3489162.1 GTPase HflX [Gammaproteobacteria bacterium]MBT3717575.1 GTPase HflX [Gammaproteobacteria bacterium]MBT3845328.1 GTPase HflX [Gammaproteobacteria bacterium]MBT3892511.1 GTPase HflX [Gammaproteobacteria bacterium]